VIYGAPGRLGEADCRAVLGKFYDIRVPEGAGELAWVAWLISDGEVPFRVPAATHAAQFPMRTTWRRMLSVANPLSVIVSFAEQVRQPLETVLKRQDVALEDQPLVVNALRRRMLTMPHLKSTCDIEKPQVVSQWLQSLLPDDEREARIREYLLGTCEQDWKQRNPVVTYVIQRHGDPDRDRPFWKDMPAEVLRAVRGWINGGLLDDLLEDGRRTRFWRRYRFEMTSIFESKSRTAVFICFPAWFAVQFKESGKATYMFPEREMIHLKRRLDPALSREVLDRARAGRHVGRYAQMGNYWEQSAQREVDAVRRRFSGV
jgi:hypothetical protein